MLVSENNKINIFFTGLKQSIFETLAIKQIFSKIVQLHIDKGTLVVLFQIIRLHQLIFSHKSCAVSAAECHIGQEILSNNHTYPATKQPPDCKIVIEM